MSLSPAMAPFSVTSPCFTAEQMDLLWHREAPSAGTHPANAVHLERISSWCSSPAHILYTGLSCDFVLLQGCRLGLLWSGECGDVFLHQTQVVSQCCQLWMLADGGDGSDLNWSCTHTSGSAECLQHRHQCDNGISRLLLYRKCLVIP